MLNKDKYKDFMKKCKCGNPAKLAYLLGELVRVCDNCAIKILEKEIERIKKEGL